MKKLFLISGALVVVGLFANGVFGHMLGGYFGGHMMGPRYGYNMPVYQASSPDVLKLREQLAAKNAEYQALLRSQNPDPKQAAQLAAEIERLRGELETKTQQQYAGPYDVPYYGCPYAHAHGMGCW